MVLVKHFNQYYKKVHGDNPSQQWTNGSHHIEESGASTGEEIAKVIENNSYNYYFVVFSTGKRKLKVLHGLFYDQAACTNFHAIAGWQTNIIPKELDDIDGTDVPVPSVVLFDSGEFLKTVFNRNIVIPKDKQYIPSVETYKNIFMVHELYEIKGSNKDDDQQLTRDCALVTCNVMLLHPFIYTNLVGNGDCDIEELFMKAIIFCRATRNDDVWDACFGMFTYFWLLLNGFGAVVGTSVNVSNEAWEEIDEFLEKVKKTES